MEKGLRSSRPSGSRHPALLGLGASALLTVLVVVGSRNLEHYDAALFGYTIASVVAFGAVVYRYAEWLRRPATRVYWRRGWQLFRDRKRLAANTSSAVKTATANMAAQIFIARRGLSRWLMHALIMWGCVISALVTFPLVWGWVHFELEGPRGYRAYLFGFPMNVMDGRSAIAWVTFHARGGGARASLLGTRPARRRVRRLLLDRTHDSPVVAPHVAPVYEHGIRPREPKGAAVTKVVFGALRDCWVPPRRRWHGPSTRDSFYILRRRAISSPNLSRLTAMR